LLHAIHESILILKIFRNVCGIRIPRKQEEAGGTRRNKEEAGGTRRNEEGMKKNTEGRNETTNHKTLGLNQHVLPQKFYDGDQRHVEPG
jgi:hypothetical protein